MYVTEQFVQSVHMTAQDRRITKTRKAIYNAFLHLLNQKDYEAITVQEIIDLADVGRSTFYSHYESKELLLDELCQKLFHHLFERAEHLSPQDYLAHIFQHFKKNQDHVTSLLLSKNDYFIRQLQKELEHDVYPMVADELIQAHPNIPHSYLKHLVVSHFIETLSWWLKKGKSYTEQEVIQFYLEILKVGSELERSVFNVQRAILLCYFQLSSCFTNWKKSFGCHPLSKKYQSSIQTIESYLITLLLLSMLLSWSNFLS